MMISFGNIDCVNNYQWSENDRSNFSNFSRASRDIYMFKFSRIRVVIVRFCRSVPVGITGIDLTGNCVWASMSKFSSPLATNSWSALGSSGSTFALVWQLLTHVLWEDVFTCLKQGSLLTSPLPNCGFLYKQDFSFS